MPNAIRARILSTAVLFGGRLSILATTTTTTRGEALTLTAPAGPLAEGLAQALEAGEVWRLEVAGDGETVLGASYEGVE